MNRLQPSPHEKSRINFALMNLELHGCIGVEAANLLCDAGMVSPMVFSAPGSTGNICVEAVEIELLGTIEIGCIAMAEATDHPFIAEAFARMRIDQYAEEERVVYDIGYLSKCTTEELEIASARSAKAWRIISTSS